MSSRPGYGADAGTDEIRGALLPTYRLRLALEALWEGIPGDTWPDGIEKPLWELHDKLRELHDKLCAAEVKALRDCGLIRQYLVIRPLNMRKPPDAATLHKIAEAIDTLAGLGLLVTAGPDES
jgi:hypothetical protein